MLAPKLLNLNLQFFADNDPPNNPPGGNPGEPNNPPPSDPPSDPVKTFTQDDVNGIAAKEVKKAQEKLLKQLGIEDFNSAKEGLNKFKEWQDSQKTESQRLQDQVETFQGQLGEKDSTISDLQAENAAIKSGITDEKNLKAVITLAKTRVTEDVDINAAIKEVIEDYPHFKNAAADPQGQQQQDPPKWTTGQHQKQQLSEMDKWMDAFKPR